MSPSNYKQQLRLEISDPHTSGLLPMQAANDVLAAVHVRCALRAGTYEVALVESQTMAELNRRYAGKDGVTDVLAFDLHGHEDHGSEGTLGQIVICVDVARSVAEERRLDASAEVLLYFIHGLLHLAGLSDDDPIESNRMHHLEDRILDTLGFGRAYHAGSSDASRNQK